MCTRCDFSCDRWVGRADLPFRMVAADTVNRQALAGKAGVSGKVETGALAVGGRVLFMPQGVYAVVKDIQVQGVSQAAAMAGQLVDVGLDTAPPDLEAGSVLCHPEYPLHVASSFRVRVHWCNYALLACGAVAASAMCGCIHTPSVPFIMHCDVYWVQSCCELWCRSLPASIRLAALAFAV